MLSDSVKCIPITTQSFARVIKWRREKLGNNSFPSPKVDKLHLQSCSFSHTLQWQIVITPLKLFFNVQIKKSIVSHDIKVMTRNVLY